MAISERNIRNIFFFTAPNFVSYGLNLVALPILARVLTPDDFGIVALAQTFPVIAVSVFTMGLAGSAQRFFFEYKKDRKKLNSLYFTVQLYLYLMLLVSSFFVYISKEHISDLIIRRLDYGLAILIAYVATYISSINVFYLRIFQNQERGLLHGTIIIFEVTISILMSLLLVCHFRMSYMGLLYGPLVGRSISCIMLSFHFNKSVYVDFSREVLFDNIKYGIQVVPKSFTSFINGFFDKYMLNAMLSMSLVGVYGIGQKIVGSVSAVMSGVWMSFQPVIYREIFERGNEASATVGRMFTIFCYVSSIPVILAILFAKEIVFILFPPSYYGSVPVIVLLAVAISTQTFGMFVSVQFGYRKRPFWIFPGMVLGTLINVIGNILFIPKYGLMGACFVSVLSTTVIHSFWVFIGQRLYRVEYEWKTVGCLLGIMMAAALFVLCIEPMNYRSYYVLPSKAVFLMLFAFVGIKTRVITRQSIAKISSAIFKPSKLEGIL